MKKNNQKKILSLLKTTGLFSILSILSFAGLKTILSYTTESLKKIEFSFRQISKEPQKKKWSENTQQVIRKRMRNTPPKIQYRVCDFHDSTSFKFFS